ncbi:hypothetical protein Pcinc_028520 [Petrolisthes cinctipes]|uniref:Wsv045-like protein n=1 Tax=Petrolisthes cinctipes TaxID=88211 RepID=A0AAE1F1R5_PETCI|nr:hypothetical protein Pcinc_028520 [Petrolisthes cinctipes]
MARLAIYYVRSFTDTWAFLINETLSQDDILAPNNAITRWQNAVKINNPLMTMTDSITRDNEKGITYANFDIEVDEANGEHHAAIVLMAMDSFISLLSASNAVQSRSKRTRTEEDPEGDKDGSFSLYVPAEIPPSDLLSNKVGRNGFPVGDTGPFRKWSTVNAIKLSTSESNRDVIERLHNIDGDVNSAAVKAAKNTNRHLDNAEMIRCLTVINKRGEGDIYTLTSDRNANTIRSLEKGGVVADAAIAQRKKSRRKRDMAANPQAIVEKFVSPKKKKLFADTGSKSRGKKRKADTDPPAKKQEVKTRRGGGAGSSSTDSSRSKYTSSHKFTSLVMSPKEFSIAFNASSSLRGAQRTKSLIGKYISLLKAKSKSGVTIISRWVSPPDRRIIVSGDCREDSPKGLESIAFAITCRKSSLFLTFSTLQGLIRQWFKVSGDLYSKMDDISAVAPKMVLTSDTLKKDIRRTAKTLFRGVRPVTGFKVPASLNEIVPPSFFSNSSRSNGVETERDAAAPSLTLGITNDRYMKIIEVLDFLLSGGVFVNACLNNMFFDKCISTSKDAIDRKSSCPVNVDLMVVASECLGYITTLQNYYHDNTDVTSLSPLLNNESPRQHLERKMTIIIEFFLNASHEFRMKRRLQEDMTSTSSELIMRNMNVKGALSTFGNFTVAVKMNNTDIIDITKKRWWTNEHLSRLDAFYGMEDSLKYGSAPTECGIEAATSTSVAAASVTTSVIITSSLLTDACLAKLTSSKSLPSETLGSQGEDPGLSF